VAFDTPQQLRQSLESSLDALGRGLRVVRDGPPIVHPGSPVTISLLPSAAELNVDNVANPLVSLSGALGGNITGSSAEFTATVTPEPDNDGFAALVPTPFRLPVRVEMTWSVHEDVKVRRPHSPVPSVQRVPADAGTFIALDGLTSPVCSFAFLPEVTELTSARPSVSVRFVRAHVELTVDPSLVPVLAGVIGAEPITVGPVVLPDVPVLIPALAVPKVLALFRHDTFEPFQEDDGFVLIVVPSSSPLRGLEQLDSVLGELGSVLSKLSALRSPGLSVAQVLPRVDEALNNFAAFLLGVRKLAGAQRQPHVRFRVADSIADLNELHMIKRSFADTDLSQKDTRAGDEISSLIFIGLPGEKVKCWNNTDFRDPVPGSIGIATRDGQLLITARSEMIVAIPNLHSALPKTEPPGRTQVSKNPDNPETFGDALRSFAFESPP
jgi:hypothetical protein